MKEGRRHLTWVPVLRGWAQWSLAAPLVALATLYFATRYVAAGDAFARTSAVVASLLLALLAAVRYAGSGARASRALLGACAVALVATYVGRSFGLPPFSGWREAIPACQAAVALVLFTAAREERRATDSMPRPERIALLLLATLGPALAHAASNLSYLPGLMLLPYLGALVAFGLAAHALVLVSAAPTTSRSRLVVLAAAFTLSMLLLPTVRRMLGRGGELLFDFFVLYAVVAWVMSAVARRSHRFLLVSLACFAGLQIVGIGRTLWLDAQPAAGPTSKVPAEIAGATPVDTPSVYLLVYDGIPEIATLEALGFDSTAQKQLLARHGFKVYPGTYSVAATSLESMARSLDMREQLRWPALAEASSDRQGVFYQRVRGGSSSVNHLFQSLGYTTYAILPTFLAGNIYEVNELLPKGTGAGLELGATLLRGVLQGDFRSDTKGWRRRHGSEYFAREKHAVITSGRPRRFVDSHITMPGHSQNTGRCRDNERELWGERYRITLGLMEQDFAAIATHDPTAVVIAMSDHGPDLSGGCIGLRGYELAEITRLDVLDRFSTLVAIRWPDPARAARYDADLMTNQDVFPTLFAYLYDSQVPLAWRVPREVRWQDHVFLRDGQFIPYDNERPSEPPP